MALFNQNKKVNLIITSGKQFFNKGLFSTNIISLQKDENGNILLGNLPGKFEVLEYSWEGARYQMVSNTVSHDKGKTKNKGKEKRTGHLTGAVVGTLLFPGVGTAIGAAVGTGKKNKGETKHNNTGTQNTITKETEIKSNATMRFRNLDTGESFVIGFQCDSKLDAELQNFCIPKNKEDFAEGVSQQKSNVELLKEYKELLDMGIITQDEFMQKKKELLG